jgi:hypothetical protein
MRLNINIFNIFCCCVYYYYYYDESTKQWRTINTTKWHHQQQHKHQRQRTHPRSKCESVEYTRMGRDGKEMGPNDATRRLGLVCFIFIFIFLLLTIIANLQVDLLRHNTTDRPTQANEGQ